MADEILRIQPPTRVLSLRNIVTLKDSKDTVVFSDLYSDIMDKCSQFGKVLEIKIPRPKWIDRSEENKVIDDIKEGEELKREEEESKEATEAE